MSEPEELRRDPVRERIGSRAWVVREEWNRAIGSVAADVGVAAVARASEKGEAMLADEVEGLAERLTPLLAELVDIREQLDEIGWRLDVAVTLSLAAGRHEIDDHMQDDGLALIQRRVGYDRLEALICGAGMGELLNGPA
jgi:hypothetical protein